jgi:hypothetical protein
MNMHFKSVPSPQAHNIDKFEMKWKRTNVSNAIYVFSTPNLLEI